MVSPVDMFRDGPNLHAYLRGRVVEGTDPSGLLYKGVTEQLQTTSIGASLFGSESSAIVPTIGAAKSLIGQIASYQALVSIAAVSVATSTANAPRVPWGPTGPDEPPPPNDCPGHGQIFERYSEAQAFTAGLSGECQAHHLVEVRHLVYWKLDTDGPAVILTRTNHLFYTNELRARLPYGIEYKRAQVGPVYFELYPSDWWAAIQHYFP